MSLLFRKRSSIIPQQTAISRRQSVIIQPLEYVLQNTDEIKFAYYQTSKLYLGRETVNNLELFFPDHSPVQLPSAMIKCFITSSGDDKETTGCILSETSSPGLYTVSLTPFERGFNELYIKINGSNKIRHTVKAPVSILPSMRSTPTNTFTRLKYPYSVEIMKDGILIVTEYFNHRITFLDRNGKKIGSIGTFGSNKGQFNHPTGLAITQRGTLLVADSDNHRILELKLDGNGMAYVGGRKGIGPLQFNKPEGIAVCPTTGMIYIADCYNHRIQVLCPDLSFSHFIGRLGTEPGEFRHPFDLTFDSQGCLYITDRCNNRLQKFMPDGTFNAVLCKGLDGPTGITVDDQDTLFVCEYGIDLIAAVSTKGQFIPCELQGRCKGPYGIKFNQFNGDIIVCDTRNNRLLIF